MFQTKFAEKIKTHILYLVIFLKNRAIYEIKWKNIVQSGRPQVTIWYMHTTYLIPKVINAHSEYLILIAFQLQEWLHKRTSMLQNTYIACLVTSKFKTTEDQVSDNNRKRNIEKKSVT
jgi:hypothetical protein